MDPVFAAVKSGDLAKVEEALAQEGVCIWREADVYKWSMAEAAERPKAWLEENALVQAVQAGSLEMTALLLRHGFDVSTGHNAPLRLAAAAGHVPLVTLLLAAEGADAVEESEGPRPLSALGAALKAGQHAVVELLATTPTCSAAVLKELQSGGQWLAGGPALAQLLLAKGLVSLQEEEQGELLCRAAQTGAAGTLQVLLAQGADPNAPDGRSEAEPPALLVAARAGQAACVAALLEAGADVHYTAGEAPDYVYTALGEAARSGSAQCVAALLAAGADPLAECGECEGSACAIAAAEGHLDCVLLLLQPCAGASAKALAAVVRCAGSEGHLHVLQALGASPVAAPLLQQHEHFLDALGAIASQGRLAATQWLVGQGVPIRSQGEEVLEGVVSFWEGYSFNMRKNRDQEVRDCLEWLVATAGATAANVAPPDPSMNEYSRDMRKMLLKFLAVRDAEGPAAARAVFKKQVG